LGITADIRNEEVFEVTMNITGDHWPISPSEYNRVQKPSNQRPAAETKTNRAQSPKSSTLHKADALRKAVERLIDSGDVTGTSDGSVRESRVQEARQNTSAGAYSSRDVLGQIVDRLLDQWKI